MGDNRPSRCDVLKAAAAKILEQYRSLLDQADPPIRAVRIELRIRSQDASVHTASLSPCFETHPEQLSPR
jgi:hypothetical protein